MVSMPRRSSIPKDVNQLAKSILDRVTSAAPPEMAGEEPQKNPAAVALGKLGGAKGGKARAAALSKRRRAEIARKAAAARWKRRQP